MQIANITAGWRGHDFVRDSACVGYRLQAAGYGPCIGACRLPLDAAAGIAAATGMFGRTSRCRADVTKLDVFHLADALGHRRLRRDVARFPRTSVTVCAVRCGEPLCRPQPTSSRAARGAQPGTICASSRSSLGVGFRSPIPHHGRAAASASCAIRASVADCSESRYEQRRPSRCRNCSTRSKHEQPR